MSRRARSPRGPSLRHSPGTCRDERAPQRLNVLGANADHASAIATRREPAARNQPAARVDVTAEAVGDLGQGEQFGHGSALRPGLRTSAGDIADWGVALDPMRVSGQIREDLYACAWR